MKNQETGLGKKFCQCVKQCKKFCNLEIDSKSLVGVLVACSAVGGMLFSDLAVELKADVLNASKKVAPWEVVVKEEIVQADEEELKLSSPKPLKEELSDTGPGFWYVF